ncbi:hypothetical protein Ctha_1297 [Chloroherpeton thalassium ATCC 35110]|uniref:Uncharacterized protein n=1 Tax=Chloroherpeton thalassium (strain ATCC 35110 / GB-78) TaxID=517418 RepID=B3QZ67_CHLT3|nr:hypothetical protein [Chloroherpeton thalassium]ACF13760.1 hypothetical protein Ctha_1297 [Chloroherpeton thalassium ATCC 35110]
MKFRDFNTSEFETFEEDVLSQNSDSIDKKPGKTPFWQNYKMMLLAWVVILIIIEVGIYFNLDKFIIGNVVFLFGLLSYAFTGLLSLFGYVPFVGPLIVKALGFPFVWLLNGVGYLVSLVAIRRGYSKDVLTYRGFTIALIIGITIGYAIGKIM